MIRFIAFASLCFSTALAIATPKDDALAAAKKLADADNYTWVAAAESAGHPLMGGPTEGKTQKASYTTVSLSRNSGICIVLKDNKCALRTPAGWVTPEQIRELPDSQRRNVRLLSEAAESLKPAAEELQALVAKTTDLEYHEDGACLGNLTEEAAKALISFATKSRPNPPQIINPKGTLCIWIKDGIPTKYQYHLTARLKTDTSEGDYDRVITTTISQIGSTTVTAPEEAKKTLGAQ